jgi:hypothetical protein
VLLAPQPFGSNRRKAFTGQRCATAFSFVLLYTSAFCLVQLQGSVGEEFWRRYHHQVASMPPPTALGVWANEDECSEGPCPYCVLGVRHGASMRESGDAYRIEYERFISTNESNPWSYWMRSVAWNQLYVRHQAETMPIQPGPWDEDTRVPDPRGGQQQMVPNALVPMLSDSWGSCCAAMGPPPGPPDKFASITASSSAGIGLAAQESDERLFTWQYEGGKKRMWSDYDDETMTLMESAYQMQQQVLKLRYGDWEYTINFEHMTQTSDTTGMVRGVQRLCP